MPTEHSSEMKFDIGHVLFIDIVGYSKGLINEQSESLQKLKEIVRGMEQIRVAEAEGKLLRLPTGDGGALVFRNSPEAPVLCAMEIAKALKSHPGLRVRMGIHSGPVNEISDLNEQANIAGAGINLAQRVMDCGDAGHILLSRHVAEDLEHYPRWQAHLHELGECEVKHGVRISVVNLYNDEIGNGAVPEKFRKALEVASSAHPKLTKSTKSHLVLGIVCLAALVILGVLLGPRFFRSHNQAALTNTAQSNDSSTTPPSAKSIAVLPFENLSSDKENAYFAEGIQDEILTRLAKVADLKVISRTSTQRFKAVPSDLREIAKQLGVMNILEGSVQKSNDQVRINVQLINAVTDAHLWADIYDRKLTDLFAVESEVAKTVAETLRAKLTGAEQNAIAAKPTENSDAHDLYLRGRYFFGKRTGDDFKRAIEYFNEAIAKDPNYALAYAGIADSYALLPEYTNELAASSLPKARTAAEKALALDNNLPEAHVSLGLVWQAADLNLQRAKEEFERAIELNPNYAAAHYFLGLVVLTPFGQFDKAIAEIKHALELDPFSGIMNTNLGLCYMLARRYPEAIAQLHKANELNPDADYTHVVLGNALELNGDLVGAAREYDKAYEIEKPRDLSEKHLGMVYLTHAYAVQGNRQKALQLLNAVQEVERRGGEASVIAYGNAIIQVALGDKNRAIDWLERSYQAREAGIIQYIKVDPLLDSLRGEPRFEKLANQIVPSNSH